MKPQFTTALQLFRDGDLAAAAGVCRQILDAHGEHPDAAHLLGVMRLREGATDDAVRLLGRAVAGRPNSADFHLDLAEAYRAEGQAERAAGCCRTALRLRPGHPGALNTLGLALLDLGCPAEAVEALRQAVGQRPEFAAAHNNLGVALLATGRSAESPGVADEALDHFRRAVALDPDFVPARANLGRQLLDRSWPDEALPHSEAATRLHPDDPDPHTDLGNVLWALGRFSEARAEYLEAIRLGPDRAVPHANLGRLLRGEGRPGEAVAWLKAAAEIDPENPAFWEELAELHWEMDAGPAAIDFWQRALALDPRRAAARNALGWAIQEEGRLAEAGECYREALRLRPDLAPAHLNLGVLHEEQGDMTAAEAAYREAIRLDPHYALAHSRLATLLRGKLPDADLAAVEERLAHPRTGDNPRARLLFALAHVVDAQGDAARAADCLRQANALALAVDRRGMRAYDPTDHERFVGGLIDGFNASWFTRTAGFGLPTRRPVFIAGLPRSGTTLIEQILASHPAVHGAGELVLARRGFESIPASVGRSEPPLRCLPHVGPESVRTIAGRHLDQLRKLAPDQAERVVDKMPDNYLFVGWLATLFPNAVFIHCRRDLRDVALSCWMTDFRTLRWTNDPDHVAARFRLYRRLMGHWRAVRPAVLHEVRYEDTVADLEAVARRVVGACGLEWNPACLNFHQSARTVRTASVTQVRQPIYSTSVARWKKYERDLADLFAALPAEEPL
jgi:tetratricopeptide (TPR) repeat protein